MGKVSLCTLPPPSPPSGSHVTIDSNIHPKRLADQDFDTEQSRRALSQLVASLEKCRVSLDELKFEDKIVARGGFGYIRRATWSNTGNRLVEIKSVDVAVKELIAPQDVMPLRFALRFARELRLWSTLDHPNILPFLGFNVDLEQGVAYFVSPYISSGSLRRHLDMEPGPSMDQRKKWSFGLTQGLLYLHGMKDGSKSHPVVHGDLKCANVLINDDHRAVLCDFGLSSIMEDSGCTGFTTSDGFKGSVRWCSPELLENARRTIRSDTWAWALCILEIMTNLKPYSQLNDIAALVQITKGKPPTRQEYPTLLEPSRMWKILEPCFQTKPANRPTVQECWDRFKDWDFFSKHT